MEWCIAAARTQGLASAGVTNSSHFIGCAFYVELAARAGMIGFACGSAGQAMPPPGGLTATLGTNPLGYAYPARRHDPVILDMATTASAGAKISLAAQLGHPIEPGLLTDAAGNPTTDPRALGAGGLMLPMGGYKGFGLAMVVDSLAGVLTGAGFALTGAITHGQSGHFFWALNIEAYMPLHQFLSRVDEQIDQIKQSRRAPGVSEILVPGERGQRRRRQLYRSGKVPLPGVSWTELGRLCADLERTRPTPRALAARVGTSSSRRKPESSTVEASLVGALTLALSQRARPPAGRRTPPLYMVERGRRVRQKGSTSPRPAASRSRG